MAHYCIEPKKWNCVWRYRGNVIGTDKSLCICYSKVKPCQNEHEEKELKRGKDIEIEKK